MNKATPVDYRAVDYLPWTAETRLRFPRRSLLSRLFLSARTVFMKLFSILGNCSASFAWESGDESPQSKVLRTWLCLLSVALAWVGPGQAAVTAMILAGDETGLPVNTLLGRDLGIGTGGVTLAGYGRSGYGSYGYTTNSNLRDRRTGENRIDSLEAGPDGLPAVFRYSFSNPTDPTSLGNDRESMIGPGDSGGPLLVQEYGQCRVAGVNTFTEGYGGRFGDTGGGVVLAPYLDWIYTTTNIPEPGPAMLMLIVSFCMCLRSRAECGVKTE